MRRRVLHWLLLVDVYTVLVDETVLRRAPRWVLVQRASVVVRPAAYGGVVVIMGMGHLVLRVVVGGVGSKEISSPGAVGWVGRLQQWVG
ncbi:MAG: hypothetical protein ACRDSR_02495 [Pseudonocardiaceae bacterium]